ncbi:alpha/beta fold hydrolase [Nocardia sp. XZ_19_385]|uniref:alpha/beta fold hydrolase n=1 Tax=Nocardia sp. XZ_19_385 TaxID=2769488 RepID=UPI00188E6F1E|nr:alpha/beta hydrolase [Nocardia sp. XZ_19_385]
MTVVFVHGVPETAALWDSLRNHLDGDSMALSLPGFASARPESFAATKDAYADWLAAELRRIPGPIDLVGHDWGALLTYRIVTKYDVPLRSWVADGAAIMHPDYRWHELAQTWQTSGAGEEFVRQATDIDTRMGSSILDLYRSATPNPYRDWGPDLKRSTAPGLVITPLQDPYDDYQPAAEVARQLAANHYLMPDAGHWWMVERPAAAAEALQDFWTSLFPGHGPQLSW